MRASPRPSLVAAALLSATPAAAAPRLVVAFDDPAGDATGPGSYVAPGDTEFQDGDFDLRRFAVLVEGDEVILEVTLGAPFRTPAITQRSNSAPIDFRNAIALQNVDIYVDSDPASPEGSSACIPGRRVAFAGGRTWKAAVVLTPQPGPARTVTREALGEAARRVTFAAGLQTRGRTIVARLPAHALGGIPTRAWGWSVQVSGARWERSFTLVDRFRGTAELDAFTMPVRTLREAWAFGGAPVGEAHPRVVDVLVPPGVDKHAVLGSFVASTGAFAQVPFVHGERAPVVHAAEPTAAATSTATPTANGKPGLTVADVSQDLVSVKGPTEGIRAWQIGRVVNAEGGTVARIVVVNVLPGGLVANVVDGREKIEPGLRVAFGP